MRRVRAIRCKTERDILVVRAKTRAEYREVAEQLERAPNPCGHAHPIIFGDIYFSRGKRA